MAVTQKSSFFRDRLMGSFMWPIVSVLLVCAVTLPCVGMISPEVRLKRILEAFSVLFNATLSAYLGLTPRVLEKKTSSVVAFLLALSTSFAAAVCAVVLAFFDESGEIAASALIQTLLGPVQNWIFVVVLAAHKGDDGEFPARRGQATSVTIS